MPAASIYVTYAACGLLIVAYAWGRFNTPPTNRSSTRRTLYRWSCAGYIFTALILFFGLSSLLQVSEWRTMLLGKVDDASLSAPLISTLAMTTLLSSVPLLKRLDAWILGTFLEWGAIPAEVKRRAATMTPPALNVTKDDVVMLRESFGDASYGGTLAGHLREGSSEGLEQSEYRFTRVVKLYHRIRELATNPRYGRFFADNAEQFAALDRRMDTFLRRSDNSLTLAARLRALEGEEAYEELVRDRREAFAQACREIFRELALFLAHAILRSEPTEKDIVTRLREIGFATAEPMNEPEFPINSLTALAIGMFLYLIVLNIFFSQVHSKSLPPGGSLAIAFKVGFVRIVTVGVTVWLVQRFTLFRRMPEEQPKYFAYLLCGAIASATAAVLCLPFAAKDTNWLIGARNNLPLVLLSGLLCAALALCCNDWPSDSNRPRWLRWAEAACCGSVMVLGTSFIYFADLLPPVMGHPQGPAVAAWISLPSILGVMIGAWVPHIYREARRAAIAKRSGALRVANGGPDQPRQMPPLSAGSILPVHG